MVYVCDSIRSICSARTVHGTIDSAVYLIMQPSRMNKMLVIYGVNENEWEWMSGGQTVYTFMVFYLFSFLFDPYRPYQRKKSSPHHNNIISICTIHNSWSVHMPLCYNLLLFILFSVTQLCVCVRFFFHSSRWFHKWHRTTRIDRAVGHEPSADHIGEPDN